MVSKVLIALATVLCVCQAGIIAHQSNVDLIQVKPQGILDDAIKLYNDLRDAIQKAIDIALEDLNRLLNDFSHLADSIITGAISSINEQFAKLLAELNDLKERAHEAGVDIVECTFEKEDEFLALPNKLIGEMGQCITDKVDEAQRIVNGTIQDVKNIWQEVVETGKELENCGDGLGAVLCITKVISKIGLQAVQLPAKITGDVLAASNYLLTLRPALDTCAAVKVAAIGVDGGKLVLEIGDCVRDKINNATTPIVY